MKVAVISTVFGSPWAGSEELWYQTSLQLLNQGHQVTASLFEVNSSCLQHENFISKGGFIHFRKRFKNGRLHVLKYKYFSAYKDIFESKPDTLLLSLGSMTDLALYPDLLRHIKEQHSLNIITITLFNSDTIILDTYTREVLQAFCKLTNHFVFVSHHNHLLAERQLAMKLNNAAIFSSPVSYLDSYQPLPPPVETEVICMACVARLDISNKGQDVLLESLSGEKWKQRNWKLTIYGNGNDKEYIQQLIHYYNLDDKVKFGGFVSDTREIWKANHWMVMASRSEGLSLAVLEAMICGRICIVTDVGGHGEVIKDSVSGFLSETFMSKYFEAALERAWAMKEQFEEMGNHAHTAAAGIFREKPVDKILNMIEKNK